MKSDLVSLVRYNAAHERIEDKMGIVCWRRGQPVVGRLVEILPSSVIGGLPGKGKSTAAAMWACYIAAAGGSIALVDPHMYAPRDSLFQTIEPLSPWFAHRALDCSNTEEIATYFEWLYNELMERKKHNGCVGKRLSFTIVDEWQSLLDSFNPSDKQDKQRLETVIHAIRNVARQGRKLGMFVVLITHQWHLASTGGHEIRGSCEGRVAFRCEPAHQRLILGTSSKLEEYNNPPLQPGQAIMSIRGELHRVSFPYTTRENCERVARIVQKYSGTPLPHIEKPECLPGATPLVEPVQAYSGFRNGNLNNLNMMPDNLKECVSLPEFQAIVELGNRQLAETGKVVRTRLRDTLGWNNYDYEHKIKPVCDALGWRR